MNKDETNINKDAPPLSKKSWEMTRSLKDADNNKYLTTDQGINED